MKLIQNLLIGIARPLLDIKVSTMVQPSKTSHPAVDYHGHQIFTYLDKVHLTIFREYKLFLAIYEPLSLSHYSALAESRYNGAACPIQVLLTLVSKEYQTFHHPTCCIFLQLSSGNGREEKLK